MISLDGLLKIRAADIFHDRGGDHMAAEDALFATLRNNSAERNKSFFMVDGMVLLFFIDTGGFSCWRTSFCQVTLYCDVLTASTAGGVVVFFGC